MPVMVSGVEPCRVTLGFDDKRNRFILFSLLSFDSAQDDREKLRKDRARTDTLTDYPQIVITPPCK